MQVIGLLLALVASGLACEKKQPPNEVPRSISAVSSGGVPSSNAPSSNVRPSNVPSDNVPSSGALPDRATDTDELASGRLMAGAVATPSPAGGTVAPNDEPSAGAPAVKDDSEADWAEGNGEPMDDVDDAVSVTDSVPKKVSETAGSEEVEIELEE